MKINDALLICSRNDIKVYPVSKNGFWYVEVSIGEKVVKTYNKKIGKGATLSSKSPKFEDVNWCEAIEKTTIHYAEKFNKKHNEK